jgi:hypothetical protein
VIYYFCPREDSASIGVYLSLAAQRPRGMEIYQDIAIVPYEAFVANEERALQEGTYVFTFRNHFSALHVELINRIASRAESQGLAARILNRPLRFKRRYEQLRLLHDAGVNRHNAYYLAERAEPRTWPVFLRSEATHWTTGLIRDPGELAGVRAAMEAKGIWMGDKMMVEFNDLKGPDGLYRKYGAYRVGERIVPRHVYIGPRWKQRLNRDVLVGMMGREDLIDEELRYVRDNPHAERVMEIFRLLGVDYGRIDYGMDGDRLQVWEVNTNAMVVAHVNVADNMRRPALELFSWNFHDALAAVDALSTARTSKTALH